MEQFNYHKLVNLRKRFDKYDCDASQEIVAVIDKHIEIAKKKSDEYRSKYRVEYNNSICKCDACGKEMLRSSINLHKKRLH
jgi:hypothetical protein